MSRAFNNSTNEQKQNSVSKRNGGIYIEGIANVVQNNISILEAVPELEEKLIIIYL